MSAMVSPAGRYYRPELDIVRFVAFLLVFLAHTMPRVPDPRIDAVLKGFAPVLYACSGALGYGLSIFFTLSAFLICELLLREREATGTVAAKEFYLRRILRIWPLYYLGLAIGVAVAFLPGADHGSFARLGWFVIFMGAWETAAHGWLLNPMFSLWSISVEEQFYLLVPIGAKYLNRKFLYGFCLLIIAGANLRLLHMVSVHASSDRIWADSLVQFECFAAGMLLCLALRGRMPRIKGWQRLTVLAAGWCCLMLAGGGLVFVTQRGDAPATGWFLMCEFALASLGSVLLILGFLGVNPKVLPAWVVYLGRISFGLYVFHGLAVEVVGRIFPPAGPHGVLEYSLRIVLAFCLTVLAALASYRFFELPFLRLKQKHAIIESQPIAEHFGPGPMPATREVAIAWE